MKERQVSQLSLAKSKLGELVGNQLCGDPMAVVWGALFAGGEWSLWGLSGVRHRGAEPRGNEPSASCGVSAGGP